MASEAAERALALHQRLIAGDPTASAELFEDMLDSLTAYLLKRHRSALDQETLHDIAVDALMSYATSPDRFDPSRSGLFRYLTLIADGDARDAIRRQRRHPIKFESFVEDRQLATNSMNESGLHSTPHKVEVRIDAIAILDRYRPEICSDPGDEEVLALILHGEREAAAFARVLGLDDPESVQARRIVLRTKDKIKRRLRRLRDRLEHARS